MGRAKDKKGNIIEFKPEMDKKGNIMKYKPPRDQHFINITKWWRCLVQLVGEGDSRVALPAPRPVEARVGATAAMVDYCHAKLGFADVVVQFTCTPPPVSFDHHSMVARN